MSFTLFVFYLFFLFGFIGMIVTFTPISNKYMNDLKFELYMSPIWYLFTFFVLGTFGAYFLIDKTDFIEPLTPLRAFLPIFLAILIFCVSQLNNKFVVFLTILLSVTVTVFFQ